MVTCLQPRSGLGIGRTPIHAEALPKITRRKGFHPSSEHRQSQWGRECCGCKSVQAIAASCDDAFEKAESQCCQQRFARVGSSVECVLNIPVFSPAHHDSKERRTHDNPYARLRMGVGLSQGSGSVREPLFLPSLPVTSQEWEQSDASAVNAQGRRSRNLPMTA